ncbi:MAG TPA: DHH family phosphoesterase [Candidatus Nanoarchaeia archaeon]|nr:DHH family phosphoesterase [Candidatus Nanoarchaeia archaeon]
MDPYEQFNKSVMNAAEEFKNVDKKEVIRLISHLDADGISSASIMIKLLNSDNRKYSVTIVPQLNRAVITQFASESYNCFIFTDLGSGMVSEIQELLKGRKIFILDHHAVEESAKYGDIVFVNPHLFGIDGGKEISGAGVVLKFACAVDKAMEDMAHVAIIGAMGDMQYQGGFLRLNQEILDIAVRKNKIKVTKGLRIFGIQTKPLHKALEYCTDPYIPGVSGSESGAIQFLSQIGIDPKKGSGWKKIAQLDEDEMKKLITGIIMKRLAESKPDDVLGDIYILPNEQEESPTRDAKEFATLLNACGRLGRASYGIGACLGDKKIKQQAIRSLTDYKKEIVNALNWYNENKFTDDVHWGSGFVIINAKDKVMSTMIGTLASILSKSNVMTNNLFILSMAQAIEGNTKISLRTTNNLDGKLDLRNIMGEIIEGIGNSEAGGHQNAAGAVIPTDKENNFINAAKDVLGKYAIVEKIG